MQISSSLPSSQALTKVKPQLPVDRQQVNARSLLENKQTPDSAVKAVSRFDIDEQALELVNQQLTAQQKSTQDKTAAYDQPSEQNYTAVATYQSIDNLAQRESIQQTFGVDFFA